MKTRLKRLLRRLFPTRAYRRDIERLSKTSWKSIEEYEEYSVSGVDEYKATNKT